MNRFASGKKALYIVSRPPIPSGSLTVTRVCVLQTENAANRIKELIAMNQASQSIMGVRVGVRRRGCNGYSYVMNYA